MPAAAAITAMTLVGAEGAVGTRLEEPRIPVGVDPEVEQAVVPAAQRRVAPARGLPDPLGDRVVLATIQALLAFLATRYSSPSSVRASLSSRPRIGLVARRPRTPRAAGNQFAVADDDAAADFSAEFHVGLDQRGPTVGQRQRDRGVVLRRVPDQGDSDGVVRVDRLHDDRERRRSERSPARSTCPSGTATPAAATIARALALSAAIAITSGVLPT